MSVRKLTFAALLAIGLTVSAAACAGDLTGAKECPIIVGTGNLCSDPRYVNCPVCQP